VGLGGKKPAGFKTGSPYCFFNSAKFLPRPKGMNEGSSPTKLAHGIDKAMKRHAVTNNLAGISFLIRNNKCTLDISRQNIFIG
jgi:hypothetical protein